MPPVSTLGSNIYFPALSTISNDLHVSVELVNLTITSYLLFQAISPSFWGPFIRREGSSNSVYGHDGSLRWSLHWPGRDEKLCNTDRAPVSAECRQCQYDRYWVWDDWGHHHAG